MNELWLVAQASLRDEFISWRWVGDHLDLVWERTIDHLELTAFAVGVGLAIALALSLVALRWPKTYSPITWVTGFFYTVPSLALFAFLVSITGLGFTTSEIALVSYTLLILVRNIVTGVNSVSPAVIEAADAMGYTPLRRFISVELRLATPTIIAGVRVATVTVVGLVTITALVGMGGYGLFILDGLRREFSTPIVLGTGLSLVLAVLLDLLLVLLERLSTPWAKRGAP